MWRNSQLVVFASALSLWLAAPALAEEPSAPAAPAAEFTTRSDIRTKFRGCLSAAKEREAKRACRTERKEMIKAHRAKMRTTRNTLRQWRTKERSSFSAWATQARAAVKACGRDKACRKAKREVMKTGKKAHMAWRDAAAKWWRSLRKYARNGGGAPTWDPPALPEWPAIAAEAQPPPKAP